MNLIIDRGNTLYKTAVFDGSDLKAVEAFKELSVSDLEKIFSKQRIKRFFVLLEGDLKTIWYNILKPIQTAIRWMMI